MNKEKYKYSDYLKHDESDKEHAHGINTQSNVNSGNTNVSHCNTHELPNAQLNSRVLLYCLILAIVFAVIEWVGGYFTHSIALKSDAIHMLTDGLGLLVAYIASRVSRRPATIKMTFGYGNAEAIGGLISGTFTIILTLLLLFEALERFISFTQVNSSGVIIIAGCGLITNAIIALILNNHTHSLNIRAAFIHVIGDLLISLVTIIAGIIIYFTGLNQFDPLLSIIIIAILLISNYKLMKQAILVLMAGVPEHIDYEEIGASLEKIPEIIKVHDLHVWYMATNKISLSAHIMVANQQLWPQILHSCQKMLAQKYHIEHVTLQHEIYNEVIG